MMRARVCYDEGMYGRVVTSAVTSDRVRLLVYAALLTIFLVFITPVFLRTYAQATLSGKNDLSAAIKVAILADPRSQSLSSEQIILITSVLAEKAASQGIKANDLFWRPMLAHTMMPVTAIAEMQNDCGDLPSPLCTFNRSIGLRGSDVTFIVWLGVLLTIILAVIATALEIRHYRRTNTGG